MSNEINRIYSFLATFGKENEWIKEADENQDGAITINEFRSLIDAEWDTNSLGQKPENDIINKFFRKFDDNNSGANKDRIKTDKGSISNLYAWSAAEYNDEEMQNKVEVFVKINEVLAGDTSIKAKAYEIFGTNCYGDAYSEWLAAVKNEVMNQLGECKPENITTEKIAEVVNSPEMNKFHAKYGVKAFIEEISKNYADLVEHGYDIAKDSSLNSLINSLIEQGTDLDAIKTRINNYLVGKEVDGSETSPITSGQKDLAGAQLRKALLEALQSSEEYDSKYKAAYESAVDEYVAQVKEGAEKMSEITDKTITNLKADEIYKEKLQEKIEREKLVQKAKEQFNNHLNAVIENMSNSKQFIGQTLPPGVIDSIIKEIKDVNWEEELDFNAAIDNIFNEDGEIDTPKYMKWIEGEIALNFEKLFKETGYTDIDDKSVEGLHTVRMSIIEKADYSSQVTEDKNVDDIRLEYTQNAAIDYCDWIAGKSDKHIEAIQNVFGTPDYESAIKNLSRQEIINKLGELKTATKDIKDYTSLEVTNWSDADFSNLLTSYNYNFKMNASFNDDVNAMDVKYSCSEITKNTGSNVKVVNANTGEFKLVAGSTAGTDKFTVTVTVGNRTFTKEITITVKQGDAALDKQDFADYGTGGSITSGKKSEDSTYWLFGTQTWSEVNGSTQKAAKDKALKLALEYAEETINKLKNSGKYDTNVLSQVYDRIVEYFTMYIGAIYADGVDEQKETWTPCAGNTSWGETVNAKFFYRSRVANPGSIGNFRTDEAPVQFYRFTLLGQRWDKVVVSKDFILDKIIQYYGELTGGEININ